MQPHLLLAPVVVTAEDPGKEYEEPMVWDSWQLVSPPRALRVWEAQLACPGCHRHHTQLEQTWENSSLLM